jgi:hypothetical protein
VALLTHPGALRVETTHLVLEYHIEPYI